jgi:hypothetical protein
MTDILKKHTFNILFIPITLISIPLAVPLLIFFIPYGIYQIYHFNKLRYLYEWIILTLIYIPIVYYFSFMITYDITSRKIYNLINYEKYN